MKRNRNGREGIGKNKRKKSRRIDLSEEKKRVDDSGATRRAEKAKKKGRPLKEMNDSMLIKLTRSHCYRARAIKICNGNGGTAISQPAVRYQL